MDSPPLIPVPEKPSSAATPTVVPTSRSSQFVLALFLVVLVGLLLYRGFGNRFGTRPTESVSPRPGLQIDLNSSDAADLEQIPGFGPKLALAIDEYRRTNGPFHSVDDLRNVHGIGTGRLEKARPFLHVKPITSAEPEEPPVLTRARPAAKAASIPEPASGVRTSVRKAAAGDPPINLNTASADDLERLPGIGRVLAQKIVEQRTEKPFTSVQDLLKIKGIKANTLEKLKPFATAP